MPRPSPRMPARILLIRSAFAATFGLSLLAASALVPVSAVMAQEDKVVARVDGIAITEADLKVAEDATVQAASKIDKGAKVAGAAAGAMSGGMAEAATAAQELHGAAGLAGVGLGALAIGAAATAYAALGESCRVSFVGGGLSNSPMASTPMYRCCICHSSLASSRTAPKI